VLRFWNSDVDRNLDGVVHAIANAASPPTPDPSPPQAGGGETAATLNSLAPIVSLPTKRGGRGKSAGSPIRC
jgi:hypothetical protein